MLAHLQLGTRPLAGVPFQLDGTHIEKGGRDGLDEIVWWVLSMGPHCVVKKPGLLAERVRELAQGIVDVYQPTRKKAKSRK